MFAMFLVRLRDHVHEQHRPVSTRERNDFLGVAAPGLVALDGVWSTAEVAQVLDWYQQSSCSVLSRCRRRPCRSF